MSQKKTFGFIAAGIFAFICIVLSLMFGIPVYKVWQQGLSGQASLARAAQERQIAVEKARAEKEAAVLVAEAIAIVGKAAQQYPEYRYQEFLSAFGDALTNGKIEQIVYIPTEAGIPILEAGRTGAKSGQEQHIN